MDVYKPLGLALLVLLGLCSQYALRNKGAALDSRPNSAASGWATFSWPFAAEPGEGPRRTLLQDVENDKHADEVVKQLIARLNASRLAPLPSKPEERCALTRGTWCLQYHLQAPVPRFPPPYFDKPCPNDCNGVGNCNYEHGMCYCPAGWGGPDCSQPRKRPCHHMGSDKRDAGWHNLTAWSHTRCAGVCDDDVAMCYCPADTKYGHREAPPGAKPGAPPEQRGRPLFMCTPGTDKDGKKVEWGGTPYEDIFGPEGWCNADKPKFTCPCRLDGLLGLTCTEVVEQTCINQCSGHGECNQGFCKCHAGWYGVDCGLRRAGALPQVGDQWTTKPWIEPTLTHTVATEDPPLTPTRRRPYIYVYDMKSDFGTDLMQYRIEGSHCLYRSFTRANQSSFVGYNAYAAEPVLHELFLTSEHRTLDPEEADFFYVPVNVGCLFDVYGWNEIPRWPRGLLGPRTHGATMMQREAMRWLNATFPHFARRGGRDHIWMHPHDEGACYVWKEMWPGVMLSHWGRMDFPHASNTAYGQDNYSLPLHHASHPGDWRDHTSLTHPCFDPKKDLVVPAFKQPQLYNKSPFLGAPVKERDIFAFFIGDLRMEPGRDPPCRYSRCIRQRLYNISRDQHWKEAHGVLFGERKDIGNDASYSELLARSKFCFVLPGDGWSPRWEDAVLHGCIPVVIMDDVQVVFESLVDVSLFSLRIAESELPRVVDVLKAVSDQRLAEMQAHLAKVWHRYRYMGLRMLDDSARSLMWGYRADAGGKAPRTPGSEYSTSRQDDAFATILQWLYHRIPEVHGTQGSREGAAAAGAGALVEAIGAVSDGAGVAAA
ncbi:hypothetical protein HXX76_008846 [Chlamydomonas incerta]|uniref:EGF-like domain-containing protein n=1 Tax=Chlamydomonas incerta TaxID=51695 RepID=A0A835T6I1_CHLIN|nr:hypothetical protein HXX76_008846 [Chlamydomonas incerta]|eukprot:KAG2432501.1 hypothetical protein HXX76_008846 [Chlamydomonas incerta]